MFVLLGVSILLAMLLAFNSLAALIAAGLWKVTRRFTSYWSGSNQARLFFWLRMLPTVLGAAFVLLIVAPAYLEYEPRSTNEIVSVKLGLLAFASAIGICLATIRSIRAWRATIHLEADWLASARQFSIPDCELPAFRIDHQFPVIAVIGVFRPRLFIGAKIFGVLSDDEIAAAVQHEIGHLRARDNLKRAVLRASTDLMLIVPSGRALDVAWTAASESAADEHAASNGQRTALDLASALVKLSRMIPAGAGPAMPAGSFLVRGDEETGVRQRITHLLQIASGEKQASINQPLFANLEMLGCVGLLIATVAVIKSNPQILTTVHSLMERVVALLS